MEEPNPLLVAIAQTALDVVYFLTMLSAAYLATGLVDLGYVRTDKTQKRERIALWVAALIAVSVFFA